MVLKVYAPSSSSHFLFVRNSHSSPKPHVGSSSSALSCLEVGVADCAFSFVLLGLRLEAGEVIGSLVVAQVSLVLLSTHAPRVVYRFVSGVLEGILPWMAT